jgi:hypothetical protein
MELTDARLNQLAFDPMMCNISEEVRGALQELVGLRAALVAALNEIADSEGESCRRCEGNGKLYADGKAHYPSENAATINCGECGGSGRIYPDLQEIARAALRDAGETLKPPSTAPQMPQEEPEGTQTA